MIRYKCLLCGRDKFQKKGPHVCGTQYKKRNLRWIRLDRYGNQISGVEGTSIRDNKSIYKI